MQGNWLNQPYQGQYGGGQPSAFGLQPQRTGFQPQLQGQRTGFQPQQQQFQQPQPTGFIGSGARPPLGLQSQPTGYAPLQRPMAPGYLGPQPSFGASGGGNFGGSQLLSQPTGYPGAGGGGFGGGLQSQFISTFLPAQNVQPSPYMNPAQMQFAAPNQGHSLQQSFQQQNQAQTGQATVAIPWALTADEKKRYDQIFRAWDQQGAGFIGGAVAQEVFGQAGLERDDLMAIWNLADVEDRGKLNIDEFHVAMGLIYRRLNGNPIPAILPPEMAPPSARDLKDSVDFVTGLLKYDTNQRSTSAAGVDPGRGSLAKSRTFHGSDPASSRKDATVYKHDDNEAHSYKSSRRHIDRDAVRFRSNDSDTSTDLEDVKKSFKKSESLVERSRQKDDEEDQLKDDLRNLKRKIERLNDDLEYNLNSGRRTATKDDERRKIERELLMLEHEELPALSKKMEEFQREKKREKSKVTIERDRRNDKYGGRYEEEPREYTSRDRAEHRGGDGYRSRDASRERPAGYTRGTFDRERADDYEEDRRYQSASRSSPSATRSRTPPPPPPPAVVEKLPPPPPVIPPSPAPPSTASMTPTERQAHIRAEAQRRIQDRLRALGVAAPSSPTSEVETSVADRLEADKAEAARKAARADEEIKQKEKLRSEKLERERGRGAAIEEAIQSSTPAPASTPTPSKPDEAEDAEIVALEKARAERLAKVKQLEQEIAEAKAAEENFLKNKAKFAKVAPPPPPSRSRAPPPPKPRVVDDDFGAPPPRATPVVAPVTPIVPPTSTPVVPPAPTPPVLVVPETSPSSKNPFHRLGSASPAVTTPSAPKGNPFFSASPPAPTPPPASPAPVVQRAAPSPAPPKAAYRPPSEDDWDAPKEKDDDTDSSDEEDYSNRATREKLAKTIFSQVPMSAPVRPSSAQAQGPPSRTSSTPSVLAPPPPPMAPSAPSAPPTPFSSPNSNGAPVARPAALLGDIQKGLRLKKTETVDKSGPSGAGAVIGDASPPVQVYVPPPSPPSPPAREPSPPPTTNAHDTNGDADAAQKAFLANRQSVDWYGGLASAAAAPEASRLPVQQEEEESEVTPEDPLDAVDLSTTIRMRSLYAYDGQRPEDLSFFENLVILANPPKDSESPWWYGTIETSGKAGWLPKAYVEEISSTSAKAVYAYTATSVDELSFEEGEALAIVDSSEADWWRAEKGGVIGVVPASYFDLQNSNHEASLSQQSAAVTPPSPQPLSPPSSQLIADSSDEEVDESDSDAELDPRARNPKEQEAERLKVLEAAGLLVRASDGLGATGTLRRRRAAPARPARPSIATSIDNPVSSDEVGTPQQERMEDAYDLYQRVMRDLPPLPPRESLESNRPPVHISPPPSPSPSPSISSVATGRQSQASSFLSRVVTGMSRSSTSATTDRPRPVISGPLTTSPQMGAPSDRTSGQFQGVGSSWASLIDQSALDNMPDRERKRQESIFEFISTEQSYVQSLQLIIEVFFNALQPLLAAKASEIIFANVEEILLFNTVFLSELEDRQRVSRLYIDSIGDVIKTHMRGLDVYRVYCVNQRNAANILADLKSSDPALKATVDRLRVKNMEAEHLLLEPMQRLTRYPLLISHILRYTEADHPDRKPLEAALKIAEATLGVVNEAVRSRESEEKLLMLSEKLEFAGVDARLDLTAPTRLMGQRKVLKEGSVTKSKSGRSLNLYLFTDLLIFTETQGKSEVVYRWPVPLEECAIKDNKRDDCAFQVAHRGETFNVRAATPRQCMMWENEIGEARTACLVAKERRRLSKQLERVQGAVV